MFSNEPFLQILNPRHPPLGIDDHFAEQVCETGTTELRIASAVQIPVVDCFAIRRCAEAGRRRGFGRELEGWLIGGVGGRGI